MNVEIRARSPRSFSHITRNGRHLLQLETVLVTVYYPSEIGSGVGRDPAGHKRWTREMWLPKPRSKMAQGYGKFASLPQWTTMLWFMTTTWSTKIPAFRNGNLADHWPPPLSPQTAGWQVKNERGHPPKGQPEEPVFPLMIFSHGMGGFRTAHSAMCGEFASHGFVVVALEHRDGSAARTLVTHPPAGLASRGEQGEKGNDAEKKRSDVVDFVFPKDNPMDTRPGNPRGIDGELRTAQLELRLAEVEEAYQVMCTINDGEGCEIAKYNLRQYGGTRASSSGLEDVDWSAWKGRINMTQVTMLGHSFGAATTVEALRHHDRFRWISQGIIYDIWGAPLKSASDPEHRINVPLLGINSEAFMYWDENFKTVTSLCEESSKGGALTWLMTVRGTVHISQTDFCILYPHMASLFLKQTLQPQRAIDLSVSASLEFLSQAMPQQLAPLHRSLQSEGILERPCIEALPTEHRPDQKWMATRLKLKHEFRGRMMPKSRRRLKKVGGLDGDDSEVWVHIAPTRDKIVRWKGEKGAEIATVLDGPIEPCADVNPPYKGFVSAATPVWPCSRS